jgi:hypothetical protein
MSVNFSPLSEEERQRLIARGVEPRPDFKACEPCGMRGSCRAARHCAKTPRPVETPLKDPQ